MKNLDKTLDDLHSKLIRLKNTNENGNGQCYTCGDKLTYHTSECGHYPYIGRGNMMFRWNTEIHKIQCNNCNCFNDGEPERFRDNLINEIGAERLAKIEFDSRKPYKWFKSDKKQLIKEFRSKIKELLKDKTI